MTGGGDEVAACVCEFCNFCNFVGSDFPSNWCSISRYSINVRGYDDMMHNRARRQGSSLMPRHFLALQKGAAAAVEHQVSVHCVIQLVPNNLFNHNFSESRWGLAVKDALSCFELS